MSAKNVQKTKIIYFSSAPHKVNQFEKLLLLKLKTKNKKNESFSA